jgi:hypothetical protein
MSGICAVLQEGNAMDDVQDMINEDIPALADEFVELGEVSKDTQGYGAIWPDIVWGWNNNG